jgi:hypothetical protein
MFLPKNTTLIIQPLVQGLILATKRVYRKRFLDDAMVVLEDETDEIEEKQGNVHYKILGITP